MTSQRERTLRRAALIAASALLSAVSINANATSEQRVLLELFTSQSCSSCPPADAYLATLARRSDVLALSFHVDYWNGLGWVDRLSTPEFTERQRVYATGHRASVYTPQLVVDGRADVVGSDRSAADAAIAHALAAHRDLPASIHRNADRIEISLGPGQSGSVGAAHVVLVTYEPSVTDAIHGGENGGRTITYTNVVRSMRRIGEWRNAPLMLTETLQREETGSRVALIVENDSGEALAVAATE